MALACKGLSGLATPQHITLHEGFLNASFSFSTDNAEGKELVRPVALGSRKATSSRAEECVILMVRGSTRRFVAGQTASLSGRVRENCKAVIKRIRDGEITTVVAAREELRKLAVCQ